MDSAQPHTDQRDAHGQQQEKQAEPKNCAPLIALDDLCLALRGQQKTAVIGWRANHRNTRVAKLLGVLPADQRRGFPAGFFPFLQIQDTIVVLGRKA